MYLLTDARAIAALADRARAGCDVRVILEPAPYLNEDANQPAFAALAAAGRRRPLVDAAVLVHARQGADRRSRAPGGDDAEPHRRGAGAATASTPRSTTTPADVAAAEAVFAADETGATAGARPAVWSRRPTPAGPRLTDLIDGARVVARDRDRGADRSGRSSARCWRPARAASRVTLAWPGPARRGRRLRDAGGGRRDRARRGRAGHPRQGRGRRRARALPRLGELHADLARSEPRARPAAGRRRTSPGASPRPSPTTPPAASPRRRYIAVAWRTTGPGSCRPDQTDRKAYLEEQIQRRSAASRSTSSGSTEELERVRREQVARMQASQRNLRWLVIGAASCSIVLWVTQRRRARPGRLRDAGADRDRPARGVRAARPGQA